MSTDYLTIQDAYEHLLDVFDSDGKNVHKVGRTLRRAVAEAYRRFPSLHNWTWLIRQAVLTTTAPYETGTIAYSASTRQVTLSGGTWPSDAEFGLLTIANIRYGVERRNSGTVLTLRSDSCPASDIASGTTFRWARYNYLLPANIGDIRELTDPKTLSRFYRQTVNDGFFQTEIPGVSRFPAGWSVVPSVRRPGRKELALSSVPETARTLKFLYDARWGSPSVTEISTGTVSVVGQVATFSSAILTDACEGAVLRVASGSTKPTSPYGVWLNEDDGDSLSPPAFSRIILEVTSTTTAVISEAHTSDLSTKAFTISSHVDVEQNSMWDCFLRYCEVAYYKLTRADNKIIANAEAMARQSLIEAQIADAARIPDMSSGTNLVWRPVIIE